MGTTTTGMKVPVDLALIDARQAYIKGASFGSDPKLFLFCTAEGKKDVPTDRPMSQSDAYRMVRRRARDAGIRTKTGNHTFRGYAESPTMPDCFVFRQIALEMMVRSPA